MKRNKIKKIFFSITGIILYFCLLVLLSNVLYKKEAYVFIHQNTRWSYVNGKWNALKSDDKKLKKLYSEKFDIYTNSIFRGNFDLDYVNNNYKIYDASNNTYLNIIGEITAITGDYKFKINSHELSEEEFNEAIFLKALEQIGVYNYTSLEYLKQVSVDYDHDGINETIVSAMNEGSYVNNEDCVFSIVYIIDDGNPIVISYDKVNYNESFLIKFMNFYESLSLNNNPDNIIVSQYTTSERIPYCHHLYEIKEGESKLLVSSCEEEVK